MQSSMNKYTWNCLLTWKGAWIPFSSFIQFLNLKLNIALSQHSHPLPIPPPDNSTSQRLLDSGNLPPINPCTHSSLTESHSRLQFTPYARGKAVPRHPGLLTNVCLQQFPLTAGQSPVLPSPQQQQQQRSFRPFLCILLCFEFRSINSELSPSRMLANHRKKGQSCIQFTFPFAVILSRLDMRMITQCGFEGCRTQRGKHLSIGPWLRVYLTSQPSGTPTMPSQKPCLQTHWH